MPINKLTATPPRTSGSAPRTSTAARTCSRWAWCYWLYGRPLEPTLEYINEKFGKKPAVAMANTLALKAGYHYGETTELFNEQYQVPKAKLAPGTYRKITGNEAIAIGHGRGREAGRQSSWSTAAIRSRRPATSCTSCRAQELRRA